MKTMTKNLAILLVLSVLLGGCSSGTPAENDQIIATTDRYTVVKQEGQYFLRLHEIPEKDSLQGSYEISYPVYETVAEMKTAILNGDFSEIDYEAIAHMKKQDNGDILMCNLDDLYELTLPSGLHQEKVIWYGKTYCFLFEGLGSEGCLTLMDEDTFNRKVDQEFFNYFDGELRILDETEEDPERGGMIYYYHTSFKNLKCHMYTVRENEKTVYIREEYRGQSHAEPWDTDCWVFDGKNYYEVVMLDLPKAMPLDWLSSFELTPYVEE